MCVGVCVYVLACAYVCVGVMQYQASTTLLLIQIIREDKWWGEWYLCVCVCLCVCTYEIAVYMYVTFTVSVATSSEHCSSLVWIGVLCVCVCDTVPIVNDIAAHPNNPRRQIAGRVVTWEEQLRRGQHLETLSLSICVCVCVCVLLCEYVCVGLMQYQMLTTLLLIQTIREDKWWGESGTSVCVYVCVSTCDIAVYMYIKFTVSVATANEH